MVAAPGLGSCFELRMVVLVCTGAFFGVWHTLPKEMGSSFKILPDVRPQQCGGGEGNPGAKEGLGWVKTPAAAWPQPHKECAVGRKRLKCATIYAKLHFKGLVSISFPNLFL
jgi:hypothetical protein